jgi:DNA primase
VVTLRKAGGARLKGLCPFHQEKTPSFHVDPDKGFYKCFGCGKAGDAITFVRDTEQLGFTEAVEALGKRFNLVIEYEEGSGGPSREERSLRQEIFDLHDVAAEHFHQAMSRRRDATGDFHARIGRSGAASRSSSRDEFKIGAVDAGGSGLAAALMPENSPRRRCAAAACFSSTTTPCSPRRAAPAVPRPADDSHPRPPGPRGGLHRAPD